MEYEEKIRAAAGRYAEAQLQVQQADKDASGAKTRAENARLERDRIEKELKDFVGTNLRRRVICVGESRAVLIQMDSARNETYVSLESLL